MSLPFSMNPSMAYTNSAQRPIFNPSYSCNHVSSIVLPVSGNQALYCYDCNTMVCNPSGEHNPPQPYNWSLWHQASLPRSEGSGMPIFQTFNAQECRSRWPMQVPLLPMNGPVSPGAMIDQGWATLNDLDSLNSSSSFKEYRGPLVAAPVPIPVATCDHFPQDGDLLYSENAQDNTTLYQSGPTGYLPDPICIPSRLATITAMGASQESYEGSNTHESSPILSPLSMSNETEYNSIPSACSVESSSSSPTTELGSSPVSVPLPLGSSTILTNLESKLHSPVYISRHALGVWRCDVCQGTYRRRQRALLHYLNKHIGLRLQCNGQCGTSSCKKSFSSREGLDTHVTSRKIDCQN